MVQFAVLAIGCVVDMSFCSLFFSLSTLPLRYLRLLSKRAAESDLARFALPSLSQWKSEEVGKE